MDNKEVINWLTRIRDRLMTTSSKQFEAMTIAIAALEQQEKDRWRPFRCRKTTEDDCSSFDYIMDCELPEDGQEIREITEYLLTHSKYHKEETDG